jgi:rod shape-determining protein MreB
LVESIKEVLETTPPEVLSDVMNRGLYLVGGGALIGGLADLLRQELMLPIHVAAEPLTAVARGTGVILEDIASYEDVLIKSEDDFTAKA